MTIYQFNQGQEITPEILDEFEHSGIQLIDTLWKEPTRTIAQHEAAALRLFEALIAGPSHPWQAKINGLVQNLKHRLRMRPLYRRRKMRGDPALWADCVLALVVRMPVACILYRSEKYGRARAAMNSCLRELVFPNHVVDLEYERHLVTEIPVILDVVKWYFTNRPNAKSDIGLILIPLKHFLYHRSNYSQHLARYEQAFRELYHLLDSSININRELNGSWSSLHEDLLIALHESRDTSTLNRDVHDVEKLTTDFKVNLAEDIGTELADLLVSSDTKALSGFVDSLPISERARTLLFLLRARDLWAGRVIENKSSPYGVLHISLDKFRCWRELNETIRKFAEQNMEPSDQQLLELVMFLPGSGNIISTYIVDSALKCCAAGGYPQTLHALQNLEQIGELATVPFFDETLKRVRRGLLLI